MYINKCQKHGKTETEIEPEAGVNNGQDITKEQLC